MFVSEAGVASESSVVEGEVPDMDGVYMDEEVDALLCCDF